jgi:hypothetical protein
MQSMRLAAFHLRSDATGSSATIFESNYLSAFLSAELVRSMGYRRNPMPAASKTGD